VRYWPTLKVLVLACDLVLLPATHTHAHLEGVANLRAFFNVEIRSLDREYHVAHHPDGGICSGGSGGW
jgi:hypothetical protein